MSGFSTLGGITKLSQLTIDVAKDWLTYRIDNIGAPDSDDDALQRGLAILKALLTAQGQMIYASAPSTPASLDAPGSAMFLKHPGGAANPLWATVGGVLTWTKIFDGDTDTPTQVSWVARADMPNPPRTVHAGAAISGIMYNTAGYGTAHLKDNDAYDPLAPWQLWSGSLNQGDIIIIDCVSALPFFAFARKFCGYSVFYCPSARSGNITLATDYSYKGVKIYRGVFS